MNIIAWKTFFGTIKVTEKTLPQAFGAAAVTGILIGAFLSFVGVNAVLRHQLAEVESERASVKVPSQALSLGVGSVIPEKMTKLVSDAVAPNAPELLAGSMVKDTVGCLYSVGVRGAKLELFPDSCPEPKSSPSGARSQPVAGMDER